MPSAVGTRPNEEREKSVVPSSVSIALMQKAIGVDFTPSEVIAKVMDFHHWIPDIDMYNAFFNKSASAVDWLIDLGIEFDHLRRRAVVKVHVKRLPITTIEYNFSLRVDSSFKVEVLVLFHISSLFSFQLIPLMNRILTHNVSQNAVEEHTCIPIGS